MKLFKQSLLAVAGVLFISFGANAQDETGLKFNEDSFNFGDVEQGVPVSHEFEFTNNSDKDITITNVKASCGCTATNYTKTAIKPGETGSVTATYNARNPNHFTKTVTVTSNDTDKNKVLIIKGNVIAKDKEDGASAASAPAKAVASAKPIKPQPKAAAPSKTHTVAEGETLSILAGKYYGDIYKYNVIYNANKDIIADSKLIYPGQVIKIPAAM
ncbi:DUF1573 domain-containing protein [Flavobacterium rhizosphaerae]|uniref:DUF1573 domain-containing protein n=1 Tax=Flavobacterium rhizosphaerae TaxID=3163298 RepID=A0ABW8YV26_9FLAO